MNAPFDPVRSAAVADDNPSRSLQPALPKAMYVDHEHFARERELVLFDSWFCVGRVADLGLDTPGRLAVLDVVGESILVTSDAEARLHAAYNVCRHRGSQVVPTSRVPRRPPATSVRCGALTTPGRTTSTAVC